MVALRRLVALWSYGCGVKIEERDSKSFKKESYKRKEPDSSTTKKKKKKKKKKRKEPELLFTSTFFLSDILLLLEESTMRSKSIPMKGTIFSNRNMVITN